MWQPALTQLEKRQIERVQKCALYIILGEGYIDYDNALETLSCDNLNTRRVKMKSLLRRQLTIQDTATGSQ